MYLKQRNDDTLRCSLIDQLRRGRKEGANPSGGNKRKMKTETIKSLLISVEHKDDQSQHIEVNGVHVGKLECEVAGQCRIICNKERIVVIMDVNEIRKEK